MGRKASPFPSLLRVPPVWGWWPRFCPAAPLPCPAGDGVPASPWRLCPRSGRRDTAPPHAAGCTGAPRPRVAGCGAARPPCTPVSRALGCGCSAPRYPSSSGRTAAPQPSRPASPVRWCWVPGCTGNTLPLGVRATPRSSTTPHPVPSIHVPPSVGVHGCVSSCLHDVQLPLGCRGTGFHTSLRSWDTCACACSPQGSGHAHNHECGVCTSAGVQTHAHTSWVGGVCTHRCARVCVCLRCRKQTDMLSGCWRDKQTSRDGSPRMFSSLSLKQGEPLSQASERTAD